MKISVLITQLFKYIPFVVFYFSFFIVMFPKQTITYVFGRQWAIVSVEPLLILLLANIFSILATQVINILAGAGLVKEKFRAAKVLAVLNVITSLILIKAYGLLGVAISSLFINIISLFLHINILKKIFTFRVPAGLYLTLLLYGLFLYIVHLGFHLSPDTLLEYIIYGVTYTLLTLALAFFLKLVDMRMIKTVLRIY